MLFITIAVDIYFCILTAKCEFSRFSFSFFISYMDIFWWRKYYTSTTLKPSDSQPWKRENERKEKTLSLTCDIFVSRCFLWLSSAHISFEWKYTRQILIKMKRNVTHKHRAHIQTFCWSESVCRKYDGKWGNCRNGNLCMNVLFMWCCWCHCSSNENHPIVTEMDELYVRCRLLCFSFPLSLSAVVACHYFVFSLLAFKPPVIISYLASSRHSTCQSGNM